MYQAKIEGFGVGISADPVDVGGTKTGCWPINSGISGGSNSV